MNIKNLLVRVWLRMRSTEDGWGSPVPPAQIEPNETDQRIFTAIPAVSPDEQAPSPPTNDSAQNSIQDLRRKLVLGQSLEEEESLRADSMQIIPAQDEIPTQTERRSFTDEGMVTKTRDFMVQTAEGRFVRGADLHGGGRCSVCIRHTDKIMFCEICRRALCLIHANPWEKGHLCPTHYKQMCFRQDTWTEDGKGKSR